jgi:hypothetical protein
MPGWQSGVIEIGGNDLLMGVSAEEFGRALDALISKVIAPGRTGVMFELPLLPQKIAYGQIQRRLATKYGIPKRYFTEAIGDADATSDGLTSVLLERAPWQRPRHKPWRKC